MLHQRQRLPQVCCVKTQTSPETPWFDELDIVEGSWRCDEPAIRLLCTCGRLFSTLNIPSMSDEHKVISKILTLPCRSIHLPEPPVQTRRSQQDHSVPTCSGTTPHVLHLPCCHILLCHVHTFKIAWVSYMHGQRLAAASLSALSHLIFGCASAL